MYLADIFSSAQKEIEFWEQILPMLWAIVIILGVIAIALICVIVKLTSLNDKITFWYNRYFHNDKDIDEQ